MTRGRRAALLLLAVVVVGLGFASLSSPLWRTVYPYLPARAQALPYRLVARIPFAERTPVPLPPPAVVPAAEGPESGDLIKAAPAVTVTAAEAMVGAVSRATPAAVTTTEAGTGVAQVHAEPPGAVTDVAAEDEGSPGGEDVSPTPGRDPPPTDLPPSTMVDGVRHVYQRWNNCGPATLAMALGALGDTADQMTIARVLKPDPDDKNVGPEELAAYARERGFRAWVRVNGDERRLQSLLAMGLPVIIETWFIPEPGDEMGHYRLVTGYEDAGRLFRTADSYQGPDVRLAAGDLDPLWRVFNRTYVVVAPPEWAERVTAVLGADLDDATMYRAAVARAEAELAENEDAFGWFNLGSSLQALGDAPRAATAFDRARALGLPWRMLWYQHGPFEAYAALGRWEDVQALAEANLRNAPNLEESVYWRGRARAAAGDVAGAVADFRRALALNGNFEAPRLALGALP